MNEVLQSMGFQPIKIPVRRHEGIHKIARQFLALHDWHKALNGLTGNDVLLIQYPPLENSLAGYLRSNNRKGAKAIPVIKTEND